MNSLWKHQIEAIDYAKDQPATMFFMGLGTGKSRCVVELISTRNHQATLIVCPLSVVPAWELQFETHYAGSDSCRVTLLNKGSVKSKRDRAEKVLALPGKNVIVINYDSLWRPPFREFALKAGFDMVVCDEIHRIKAPGSKVSRYMMQLGKRVKFRLGLSGTPLSHSPMDAYGEFRFLDPSVYGTSFTRFRGRYAVMGGFEGRVVIAYQNQKEFNEKFYSITYRADRDVLDLPGEHHVTIPTPMPDKAMRIYKELEKEFVVAVADGVVSVDNALVKLLRLQQISSGHLPLDEDEGIKELHNTKEVALYDLLDSLDPEEPVTVFCRFKADLAAVHRAAEKAGRTSSELSGSRKELEIWQNGDTNVLAVQIRSGSEGITLVRAKYSIYFSLSFSLSDYLQSMARIHRPGQTHNVTFYHLVTPHTVDEKVYKALAARQDVITEILKEYRK